MEKLNLLSLPHVVLEHIFSFLTYDQVAKNRVVCKDFNTICQHVLNRGFQMMEKRLSANLRAIKAQLPRRESERRFHPLSRHCDILTSIETRFSMLSMAYGRFIDQGMCCFIPGKVLDELRHVVSIVDRSNPLPLAFEILQELRDISGMAIEHFEDVVAPSLRQRMQEHAVDIIPLPVVNRNDVDKKVVKPGSVPVLEMALLREACLKNSKNILKLEKRCIKLYRKLELYKRLMALNKRQMLQKQFEQDRKIGELKRKVEEYEVKFNELSLSQYVGYKTFIKETDTRGRIANMIAKTNKMLNLKMRLKNFGSQIRLDPSPLRIGPNKGGRGSPIIKPRRASLNPPSHKLTEDNTLEPKSLSNNTVIQNKSYLSNIVKPIGVKSRQIGSMNEVQNALNRLSDALNESSDVKKSDDPLTSEDLDFLKKYPSLRKAMESQASHEPMPSTSKIVSSSEKEIRGKKRIHPENVEYDTETKSNSGFQTNVQLLSRTIMKLIESMTDGPDAKRKRLRENDE